MFRPKGHADPWLTCVHPHRCVHLCCLLRKNTAAPNDANNGSVIHPSLLTPALVTCPKMSAVSEGSVLVLCEVSHRRPAHQRSRKHLWACAPAASIRSKATWNIPNTEIITVHFMWLLLIIIYNSVQIIINWVWFEFHAGKKKQLLCQTNDSVINQRFYLQNGVLRCWIYDRLFKQVETRATELLSASLIRSWKKDPSCWNYSNYLFFIGLCKKKIISNFELAGILITKKSFGPFFCFVLDFFLDTNPS